MLRTFKAVARFRRSSADASVNSPSVIRFGLAFRRVASAYTVPKIMVDTVGFDGEELKNESAEEKACVSCRLVDGEVTGVNKKEEYELETDTVLETSSPLSDSGECRDKDG